MELDVSLKHGFDLGELKVRPLQRTIVTSQGPRNLSELAIAFLMQLTGAPRQDHELHIARACECGQY